MQVTPRARNALADADDGAEHSRAKAKDPTAEFRERVIGADPSTALAGMLRFHRTSTR